MNENIVCAEWDLNPRPSATLEPRLESRRNRALDRAKQTFCQAELSVLDGMWFTCMDILFSEKETVLKRNVRQYNGRPATVQLRA